MKRQLLEIIFETQEIHTGKTEVSFYEVGKELNGVKILNLTIFYKPDHMNRNILKDRGYNGTVILYSLDNDQKFYPYNTKMEYIGK